MSDTLLSLIHGLPERAACGLGFVARVDGRPSHEVVEQGLQLLHNLAHRGATGSDLETGDGAGILLQIPDALLRRSCQREGFGLPPAPGYAVGTIFLSGDPDEQRACEAELERIAAEQRQPVIGWRDVPTCPDAIGRIAREAMPRIRQFFLRREIRDEMAFDRELYIIRRRLHWATQERFGAAACYVVSLSSRTLVYKGLLRGPQLAAFYPDLVDPAVNSALALIHSRFSTNTLGSWPLAHPYRYVAHNGEINTLRGNVNWMRARERELQPALFPPEAPYLGPIVQHGSSDTSAFDNVLEFLLLTGRSLPHAVMMMVPEAWEHDEGMDPDRRAFYQYTAALMAPWDGPAAIAFSDGRLVGATLDRNGLRPARYSITRDGLVVLSSEEGALPLPAEDVVVRSRLQPGRMLLVDTVKGQIVHDNEAKQTVVRRRPYRQLVDESSVHLKDLVAGMSPVEGIRENSSLFIRQSVHGFTLEDLHLILMPMALTGKEPDGSMGTDVPLAVLSERPQLLFSYFKQLFAQVSNPPIDSLREATVMSLHMMLGPEANFVDERSPHGKQIFLDHPILQGTELEAIRGIDTSPLRTVTLPMLFDASAGEKGLAAGIETLCSASKRAIESGAAILVLSDRGVDAEHAPIPSLLATSAVHHALIRDRIRTRTGLVVETGEAREVHHLALLIGYGAVAINPYLALETVTRLAEMGQIEGVSVDEAVRNYIAAVEKGLLKVISKMGISTLVSYCGAQVFEAVGLDTTLVDRHFMGTASRLGGLTIEGVARETLHRHRAAFADHVGGPRELDVGGEYQQRWLGEAHTWNPNTIVSLQRAVRTGNTTTFKQFTTEIDAENTRLPTLRGLFELIRDPIDLSEVEPVEEIVKRFSTGAMSFGSLSLEAHETLAIAMNRLGGKSNTGEGGEDPDRFGDERRSAIKQVASGRFGVTAHYLVNADMLQIKMAQGSKPGEGGQLPGYKVTEEIARVRHSTPGVGLISPPPHHDIYSIEDLAQLIHDLKSVNPLAQISVKLVSEVGVGTIATGVAKARADHITISGYDGGTGASPLSSIKHAGLPWELGLAETQQSLVANGMRGRVKLQVDGGLKTGRDVVIAALMGADEFAFSTAPLVATGCIMMRACHLNTCPVGIATQNPELRRRFPGTPEHVINYFFFLAQEVREFMAGMGFRRFDEMVGHTGKLSPGPVVRGSKAASLDLSPIMAPAAGPVGAAIRHAEPQVHHLEDTLDHRLLLLAGDAIREKRPVRLEFQVRNIDRTIGAMLSGEIARLHGAAGLPDGTVEVRCRGTAGQSFGAWAASGLTLILEGEANDYVGKGLSGGRLVIAPPPNAGYMSDLSSVIGNVALYGATDGEAYVRGLAGERFAVRNSGAHAVVEGCGDHGCEYMTGGAVVVLGSTGRNFAAGMSGGVAYALDMWGRFEDACNLDMVELEAVKTDEDSTLLRRLLAHHSEWTGSDIARRVLAHWPEYLPRFVKVMPNDLRRIPAQTEPAVQTRDRAV